MATPQATDRYQARIAGSSALLIAAVRRAMRRLRVNDRLEQQYRDEVGPQVLALVAAAQVAATREADSYAAEVLNDLAFGPPTAPRVVPPQALVGFTGDGFPVEDLLGSSVARIRATGSLDDGSRFIEAVAASILADTAQAAEAAALAARPWVDGFVRVAEPGACARCLVLTGRFFLWNAGFLRHPRCRCTHVPAPSDKAALRRLLDVETADRRFEAMSRAEQDRTFGAAGAQAIRDGADINQVVNARRGMQRAQVFGRDLLVTTEGTTRRGFAYTRLNRGRDRSRDVRRAGQRNFSTTVVRLMPEAILQIAGDNAEERIRLLRFHGYIL